MTNSDEDDDDYLFQWEVQAMSLGVEITHFVTAFADRSIEERAMFGREHPELLQQLRDAHATLASIVADLGTGGQVPPAT